MVFETIQNRRAIYPHQFNTDTITKKEIEHLLEAANWAPSHMKTEPWRFKVILNEEDKIDLGDFMSHTYKENAPKFSELKYNKLKELPVKSAAVIIICMQRDPEERIPEWEETAAVAMAIQNLWLQATTMDIGGYWSSPSLIIRDMHHFLDFKEGEDCMGFFYLGRYDELPPNGERGPIEDKIDWI